MEQHVSEQYQSDELEVPTADAVDQTRPADQPTGEEIADEITEESAPDLTDEPTADALRRELNLPPLADTKREWTRVPRPGPFLIPTRRRDLAALAITIGLEFARHRWLPPR